MVFGYWFEASTLNSTEDNEFTWEYRTRPQRIFSIQAPINNKLRSDSRGQTEHGIQRTYTDLLLTELVGLKRLILKQNVGMPPKSHILNECKKCGFSNWTINVLVYGLQKQKMDHA